MLQKRLKISFSRYAARKSPLKLFDWLFCGATQFDLSPQRRTKHFIYFTLMKHKHGAVRTSLQLKFNQYSTRGWWANDGKLEKKSFSRGWSVDSILYNFWRQHATVSMYAIKLQTPVIRYTKSRVGDESFAEKQREDERRLWHRAHVHAFKAGI